MLSAGSLDPIGDFPVLLQQDAGLKIVTTVQYILYSGLNDGKLCLQGPFGAANAQKRVQRLRSKQSSGRTGKRMKMATGADDEMEGSLKEGLLRTVARGCSEADASIKPQVEQCKHAAGVPFQGTLQHCLSPPSTPPQPRKKQPAEPPQQGLAPSAGLFDPAVLLVHIARPVPEFDLQHEFNKYGTVTSTKLLEDGLYAMVDVQDPTAAAKAAKSLNNSQLCITVEVSDKENSALRPKFLTM